MTVSVERATVAFGGVTAVDGVTLTLQRGEVLALIGSNGAGKSTLVNTISGHVTPQHGTVRIDGETVLGNPERRARLGIGRTFQTPRIQPQMRVVDNVAVGHYPVHRYGLAHTVLRRRSVAASEAQVARAAVEALERFGLSAFAERFPQDLPAWTLRLIELARVLMSKPQYVFLDEPAAGIDQASRDRLALIVRELRDEGIGVLLIEHSFDLVKRVSDRVTVLDKGRVLCEGTADEVAQDARVRAGYLGLE